MKTIRLTQYQLKHPNRQKLKDFGFRYNRNMSDSEEEFYTFRFPLIKLDNGFISLTGEITISLSSGEVRPNVYQNNSNDTYALFYMKDLSPFYVSKITDEINSKFFKIFKKLGIEEVGKFCELLSS